MKVLIIYVFHEYNSRVEYFIKNGLIKDPNIQFVFVCNNLDFKLEIPDVIFMNRPNIGYDFGAWSHGLLTDNLYKQFDRFIFLNSSVIGPFLPSYYTGTWIDAFLSGLSHVKLFGCTINCLTTYEEYRYKRTIENFMLTCVQSYAFCMDKEALEYLITKNIFSISDFTQTFEETIEDREIRMSTEILRANWNIGCLMKQYSGIDFRKLEQQEKWLDDTVYPQGFHGNTHHPYELIFLKGNRIPQDKWLNTYMNLSIS
jgi:hypothetical protein